MSDVTLVIFKEKGAPSYPVLTYSLTEDTGSPCALSQQVAVNTSGPCVLCAGRDCRVKGGSLVTICTVCGSPESLLQRKALLRELFGKKLVEMRIGNLKGGLSSRLN